MTEKSEFHTGKSENMSAAAEASILIRQVAEPRPVGDSVKAAINRAAARVSKFWPMRASRAEDIWRQEARIIRAEEMDAIRQAADLRITREATHERTELEARIGRLEALLLQADADFHRPSLAALRQLGRRPDNSVE